MKKHNRDKQKNQKEVVMIKHNGEKQFAVEDKNAQTECNRNEKCVEKNWQEINRFGNTRIHESSKAAFDQIAAKFFMIS